MGDGYLRESWWKRNRVRVLGGALALVLVVSGVVVVRWWSQWCAPGIAKVGDPGQCVGVATDLFEFDEAYRDVQRKIDDENKRVEATGKSYVSIVYFAPLTLQDGHDTITEATTGNSLEGAYLAQKRANRGDSVPQIRLLLANPGSQSKYAERVVEQIKSIRQEQRVVAVAGLGQSNSGARHAIDELSRNPDPIPMFGATITADSFTDDVDGGRSWFVRIAPSNTEQIQAVLGELGTHDAMLIRDDNPDDPFAADVSRAFREEYLDEQKKYPLEQLYNSASDIRNFSSIATNVCASGVDTAVFAGRYHDLQGLLVNLKERPCRTNLNVVTLDSVASISGVNEIKGDLSDDLSLVYTQLAAPAAWDRAPGLFDKSAVNDFRDLLQEEFGRPPGDDESAIMAYDAVGIAVEGVRMARREKSTDVVEAEDLFNQLYAMNGAFKVSGASGWISLDDRGRPERKSLALFELTEHSPAPELRSVVSSPMPVLTYDN